MLSYAFCLLLVGTFAYCDMTVAYQPHYFQSQIDIDDVLDIVSEHIISTDGRIPFQDERNRQYAMLVYVIHHLGESQSGCYRPNYYHDYQKNIKRLIPEAINNPQRVVDEVRNLTEKFLENTKVIRAVIREKCFPVEGIFYESYSGDSHPCDLRVQARVNSVFFLKQQARNLLLAGMAANSFLARHKEFLAASNALKAKEYLVNGVAKLKDIVMNIADYLRASRANQLGGYQC